MNDAIKGAAAPHVDLARGSERHAERLKQRVNDTRLPNESQAPDAKSLRVNRLNKWGEAIMRLEAHYGNSGPIEGVFLAVRVAVELAAWTGELGVFDSERIASLCETFPHAEEVIPEVWAETKEAVEASISKNRRAAIRRLDSGETVRRHVTPIVTGQEISTAYRLDRIVKLSAFGSRIVRSADGTTTRTTKFKSLLPDFRPGPVANTARPEARYTHEQAKEWVRRLGYQRATINKASREKTPEEFDAWIAKREAVTWPADRLIGRKREGESDYHASLRLAKEAKGKTRIRKPGRTAALRDFAAAHGCHLNTAKTRCKGMSRDEIMSRLSHSEDGFAAIPNVTLVPIARHACPDKNGRNPLFLHNHFTDTVVADAASVKAKKAGKRLPPHVVSCLSEWYAATHNGAVLKPSLIRKWRERGTLRDRLAESGEWREDRFADTPEGAAHYASFVENGG